VCLEDVPPDYDPASAQLSLRVQPGTTTRPGRLGLWTEDVLTPPLLNRPEKPAP